ncbi:MAG: hypothetical protein MSA15_19825 [Clostridium sp.]|nr:hypothetical protein [Clostridium sp.]
MNKEEIEELKDFTIDLTDIDELALGLEVCSKKSNMIIQEFADTIIQLQQENKQLKDNWNKLKEYLNYKSERAVGEDEYVYDEIYNEIQELEQGSDNQ